MNSVNVILSHPKLAQFAARFHRFYIRGEPDQCWEWQALCTTNGYGLVSFGHTDKLRAHRVAWVLANGPFLDEDLWVLHRCDNRKCVNPAHLFLGTRQDNIDDMVAKGRQQRGRMCHTAVLTEDQVRAIRVDARSQRTIAGDYGVTQMIVSKIKRRLSWKHVG